jgi:alanyl-tRNA synthetase
VADHVRTLTFAITDGAVPSNEGRGYVLRRVLRRAVRYGMQTLGAKPGFFSQLVPIVAQRLGGAFPELIEKNAAVMAILAEEEKAFSSLLEKGVKYLAEIMAELRGQGSRVIPGDRAFYLYDTLGFPVDLTQIMAGEQGFEVDVAGFQAAMTEQKERGRVATRAKRLAGRTDLTLGAEQTAYLQREAKVLPTDDSSKYSWDTPIPTTVKAVFTDAGFVQTVAGSATTTVGVILEASPFYAEAGGQVSDTGVIVVKLADGSTVELDVLDVQVRSAA